MTDKLNFSQVSVVVRRMYYWDIIIHSLGRHSTCVSVVVRRMYYWDFFKHLNDFEVLSFSSC